MLLLHIRTVAFLASLFTAIQSGLWIIGYVLYVVAYGCGYPSQYFSSNPGDFNLPSDLSSYYVWYLQGSNCTTAPTWINSVRRLSPDVIVALASIGLSWNAILLTTSIYMIVGFYTGIGRLSLRLKIFSASVMLVSVWDLILVVVVIMDFSPLLARDKYEDGMLFPNSTKPYIKAMAYFTEVFTVIIILLSRLLLFWILNIFFASYLLAKNANEVTTTGNSPASNNNTIKKINVSNNNWDNKLTTPGETMANPDKGYFGSRFKSQIPSPPVESTHDEVTQRWVISQGKEQDFFYPDFCEEEEEYEDIESKTNNDDRNRSNLRAEEETWNNVERHIRDNDTKWKNVDATVLPNVRRVESINKATQEQKPSLLQNMRHSFSKKQPVSKPPSSHRESFKSQKQPEGFSYIPSQNSNSEKTNPFNVKLKHVPRKSITNEETERNSPETSGNNDGGANPYLVSPLSGLDPDYIPRDHFKFPITPPISTSGFGKDGSKPKLDPPPLPPQDKPKTPKNLGFTPQMSLDEAIRTRRPLKPVNRPPIDTTC